MLLLSALITAGLSVPQSKAAREIITCNYPAQCSRSEPKQSFFQCLQEFVLVLFPDPTKPIPGMGLRKETSPNFPLRRFVPGLLLLLSHTQFYDTAHILSAGVVSVLQSLQSTEIHNPLDYVSKHTCLHSQSFPQRCNKGQELPCLPNLGL